MIRALTVVATCLWCATAAAQDTAAPDTGNQDIEAPNTGAQSIIDIWNADRTVPVAASEVALRDLEWLARPVIVFADSPNDPRLRQQLDLLADRPEDLAERDVIILTDTDPSARSDLRTQLRPRGFMLVIMGKDGQVELRKPAPWNVREISRTIDKMPLRQQEIEDNRATN